VDGQDTLGDFGNWFVVDPAGGKAEGASAASLSDPETGEHSAAFFIGSVLGEFKKKTVWCGGLPCEVHVAAPDGEVLGDKPGDVDIPAVYSSAGTVIKDTVFPSHFRPGGYD
jgi:hypothetical protein